jgi:hypothetical protein
LWCGALFGVIGSWQHVVPNVVDAIPFVKSRLLHVSLAIVASFLLRWAACTITCSDRWRTLHSTRLAWLHLAVFIGTGTPSPRISWAASAEGSIGSSRPCWAFRSPCPGVCRSQLLPHGEQDKGPWLYLPVDVGHWYRVLPDHLCRGEPLSLSALHRQYGTRDHRAVEGLVVRSPDLGICWSTALQWW